MCFLCFHFGSFSFLFVLSWFACLCLISFCIIIIIIVCLFFQMRERRGNGEDLGGRGDGEDVGGVGDTLNFNKRKLEGESSACPGNSTVILAFRSLTNNSLPLNL